MAVHTERTPWSVLANYNSNKVYSNKMLASTTRLTKRKEGSIILYNSSTNGKEEEQRKTWSCRWLDDAGGCAVKFSFISQFSLSPDYTEPHVLQ